ncbi:hypothetical protein RhiirC2_868093 [Rhizophagus irregularis]|uniref:Uncharacterized protein n=1 Tax=Rhizophagus irregularis TaxID=588596 RepID=A0A2N1MYY7_9GLOM|nr:hypothetical protein RhiirC2_868093 [Rhizophagus irregularis]
MAQYRAPYERSPFTPPAVLLPMDKPRGVAILLVIYHQWQKLTTLFIGGISPGVTDDWKKFSRSRCRARELAMDEADRLREQQEVDLEQHRLHSLEEERKQREEAMETELNNEKKI